jgi:hypothetical protein
MLLPGGFSKIRKNPVNYLNILLSIFENQVKIPENLVTKTSFAKASEGC